MMLNNYFCVIMDYVFFLKFLFSEIHVEEFTDELMSCLDILQNNLQWWEHGLG